MTAIVAGEIVAACAVALAMWWRHPDAHGIPGAAKGRMTPSLSLVLRMLVVAVTQGASVPHALRGIGEAVGGGYGGALRDVAEALHRGTGWRDAWACACGEWYAADFTVLCDALETSWMRGDSPVAQIEATIEQLDVRERQRIEETAGRLSVSLLLPTGLCFLPSFVLLGVIPSIASFTGAVV